MTERILHIDVESRSPVDLPAANAFIYFDHPDTDLWCAAFSFGEDPDTWQPGDLCPDEVRDHIESGGLVGAWNCAFERLAFEKILGPRYGWPVPKLTQYRCTMVKALAMALPGKLELAAPALGLEITKDAQGGRLMLQMSKPRRPRKGEDPRKLLWWDSPDRIDRLIRYCQQDVRTEMAVDSRVLPLAPAEQALWFLDQQINSRGVYIDADLCNAAKKVVASAETRLDKELAKVTDRAVSGVSNNGQLTTWLRSKGLDIPGVAKDVIEGLLVREDLEPQVRRAVEIRQEGGKTSVAKIDAMLARRQKDGRMRGNLQFHGAATGRWAGRGAQLQNLPRPSTEDDKQPMIEAILESRDDRLIEALYGNTLTVVSDCIRGMITAAPGNELFVADFSAIEGRVNAWLAGEQRVLDAFAAYDAGKGPDLYKVTASDIYARPTAEIGKPERQVGKVGFLALGYGGGPGAFAKMAKGYGLDIATAHGSVIASASEENVEKAHKGWLERGRSTGMGEVRWKTAELIKLAWRQRNPAIVQFWRDLEDAAIEAVAEPGRQITAGKTGKITYKRVGSFLFCRLPSGRVLTYPYPKLTPKKMPWTDGNGATVFKDALVYKGVNSVTRQWCEQDFYGGLADENVTQAAARDCMANGMLNTEAAGYPCVLTVHDEGLAERRKGEGRLDEFVALLTKPAPWMKGLPLSAEGYVSERYRK